MADERTNNNAEAEGAPGERRYYARPKTCQFCADKSLSIDYKKADIPGLIIENNLHGIDLDDRAVQLAQLGLYIKALKKRYRKNLQFKIVSSDFFLPEYETVQSFFEVDSNFEAPQKQLIKEIWNDLRFAYKFGSLIRLDEKIKETTKL